MPSRRPRPASARVSSADATGRTADAGAKDAAAPRRAPFLWLAGGVFFLSGAAGLIYESIWTRYLGLLVGHTAYAQVIVLVIFMGGMAADRSLDQGVEQRRPALCAAPQAAAPLRPGRGVVRRARAGLPPRVRRA